MDSKRYNRREYLLGSAVMTASLLALNPYWLAIAEAETKGKVEPPSDLFKQINRAADTRNLRGLELGHVPQIKSPDAAKSGEPFEVEITVGQKLHEMIPAHYIDWMDLYAGEIFLCKLVLTPNFTQPICRVTLTLQSSATLKAIEHCNLHGMWEGTKQVAIT